jgi:hypothetical protein
VLDPVHVRESQIGVDMSTHLVSIQRDRVQERGELAGKRCLAGSGQSHDQDLALQTVPLFDRGIVPLLQRPYCAPMKLCKPRWRGIHTWLRPGRYPSQYDNGRLMLDGEISSHRSA